jgi:hypothetical protein
VFVRRIETKSSQKEKSFHVIGGLDTPLGLHSGLHLDKLDAALDHRKLPEI